MNIKRHAVVVTTINKPTVSINRIAQGAVDHGWQFFVAGDTKTPDEAYLGREDINYLSFSDQEDSDWNIRETTPSKTYARKMFGYLEAIKAGVNYIIDTDDDNWPLPDFFIPRSDMTFANAVDDQVIAFDNAGWVNIYQHFAPAANIWPRGFPLSNIGLANKVEKTAVTKANALVYQGLAEGAPDVDAIHRLVFPNQEFTFERRMPVELRGGSYCAFNSQNTTWCSDAFFLLYLPTTCSFRMTDIYRSYIAQRIVHEMGYGVVFHHASVHQDRNPHTIIRDFRDEVVCYVDDGEFISGLADLNLADMNSSDMLTACYQFAVSKGYVEERELVGLAAWLKDISALAGKRGTV